MGTFTVNTNVVTLPGQALLLLEEYADLVLDTPSREISSRLGCLDLARRNPAKAVKNPANYEMLANTSDDSKAPHSIGTPSKATFCSSPDRLELPIQGYIWSSPMVGYQDNDKCPV